MSHAGSPAATSASGRSQSPHYPCPPPHPALLNKRSQASLRASHSLSPVAGEEAHEESGDEEGESGEDELAIAVGQLSINEDEQVRYHGKASGLHLLGASERDDGRSEGGIWCVTRHDHNIFCSQIRQIQAFSEGTRLATTASHGPHEDEDRRGLDCPLAIARGPRASPGALLHVCAHSAADSPQEDLHGPLSERVSHLTWPMPTY